MNHPTIPGRFAATAPSAASLDCPAYLNDMRSRIGELMQVARSAPDTSHACTPDKARASRLRFIDRLDGAHDYLMWMIVENRKGGRAA